MGLINKASGAMSSSVEKLFRHAQMQLRDTGSVHMWAVIGNSAPDAQAHWAWLRTCVSLLVVSAQIMVLLFMNSEAAHPTCNSHTDCSWGNYCSPGAVALGAPLRGKATCTDCYAVFATVEALRAVDPNITDTWPAMVINAFATYEWRVIDLTNSPMRLSDPARMLPDGDVFFGMPDACASWAYFG